MMMTLTDKVFAQLSRRREVRIVRWTFIGDYHLVKVGIKPEVLCGARMGTAPERYAGEKGRTLCDSCWDILRGQGKLF